MTIRTPHLLAGAAFVGTALALFAAGQAFAGSAAPPHVDSSRGTQVIYPASARTSGEEGSVDIKLMIDASGRPTGRYTIISGSGFSDLDTAAVQSVLNWHYIPAHDADGTYIADWVRVHIDYKLPPEDRH